MNEETKNLEKEFITELDQTNSTKGLESLRVKYLGRKSELSKFFAMMPKMTREEKGVWGKALNSFKVKVNSLLESKMAQVKENKESIDLTFPATSFEKGSRHILSTVNYGICSIFENLGFTVIEGNEIEDEVHNFEALNIPLDHPSRDAFDTFYLDVPEKNQGKYLLRSHTSPSQIRIMKKTKPPLAVVSPGRVYRPDEVDATHSFMFHQIEGFVVGERINFSHLKGVLLHFVHEFFSSDISLRFRPHFFPFTEPSAEADMSCMMCESKKLEDKSAKCSVCKDKGWLEILGCGMIHPKVLESCGIDFERYQGFAFGMGVERIAMLKYGISDIRLFYENDKRFLEQFCI